MRCSAVVPASRRARTGGLRRFPSTSRLPRRFNSSRESVLEPSGIGEVAPQLRTRLRRGRRVHARDKPRTKASAGRTLSDGVCTPIPPPEFKRVIFVPDGPVKVGGVDLVGASNVEFRNMTIAGWKVERGGHVIFRRVTTLGAEPRGAQVIGCQWRRRNPWCCEVLAGPHASWPGNVLRQTRRLELFTAGPIQRGRRTNPDQRSRHEAPQPRSHCSRQPRKTRATSDFVSI